MQRIVLLCCILLKINAALCPMGYVQTSPVACLDRLGPCKTTDMNLALSVFGSKCTSCYDDAFLWPQTTVTSCIPYFCNNIQLVIGVYGCIGCQDGYQLTPNRSCVLNQILAQPSVKETSLSVSDYGLISASLIIAATAIIIFIFWVIFKLMEARSQRLKDQITVKPQTVLYQNKDRIRKKNVNSNESISQLVLGESTHPTELNLN